MACPYFMPERRFESDWPFPRRLPLGAGWTGTCAAPGHEGAQPSDEELKSGCNMGYAKACSRLPADRSADAVRFAMGEERDGILHVLFVCERAYLPAGMASCCMSRRANSGCSDMTTRACSAWLSAMCRRRWSGGAGLRARTAERQETKCGYSPSNNRLHSLSAGLCSGRKSLLGLSNLHEGER